MTGKDGSAPPAVLETRTATRDEKDAKAPRSRPLRGKPQTVNEDDGDKRKVDTYQQTPRRANARGAILDRSLQARIGEILRESFKDIEREPLPEHLVELMEALKTKESGR
ncbi:MAG TPA: NepR family anti-sigma factor [Hyphomicrobiaceae bacterium]|jgi:hypothetical protein|nr:NepR family anti-sigma factor [Hyphomicrobiaceae bacterium]